MELEKFEVAIPKGVVDACKYYVQKLEKDKIDTEEKRELNIQVYKKLMDEERAKGLLSDEEYEKRLGLLKQEWGFWCRNEIISIDRQIKQIKEFINFHNKGGYVV